MAEKLTKDLNIIQRSGIEIAVDPITADLNIIQKLDDEPNDVGGLTAAELKAKFDEAGNILKDFINDSLIPQVVGADATEAERAAAEAQRVANETARETAETARADAETVRAANEAARVDAETARETDFQASQAERAAAFDQAQAERAETFEADEAARNFWEDYDPAHAYVPGNKVYYLGSSYVNTAACQGVLPTVAANWRMIAKKGADSDEGMSQEEADLRYLQLSGGVMTGGVEVMAPTKDANPATKAYVDAAEAAAENYADEAEAAARDYADGLKQETLGNVYTREQCLTAETAALYPGLPDNPVPDDVLAKIPGSIGTIGKLGNVQFSTVYTYTGTGKGSAGSYPNILYAFNRTFPHKPLIVFVSYSCFTDALFYGQNSRYAKQSEGGMPATIVWTGNNVKWYTGYADEYAWTGYNEAGTVYSVMALMDMKQ